MKKNSDKHPKFYIVILLIIPVLLITCIALYYNFGNSETARIYRAKRIANKYMLSEYGVSLDIDSVNPGILLHADYSIHYIISDTTNFAVGVSLEDKKVVYENYIEESIFDRLNQNYRDETEAIWDKQAEVEFGGNIMYPKDKYLSKDKQIDYDRAMSSEGFELDIVTENPSIDFQAGSLYNTISFIKENDINIDMIRLHDFSGDGLDEYKHYAIQDLDQFKDTDMVLEFLKNYEE